MTLRLTIHSEPWRRHVVACRTAIATAANASLLPVVKGNGYGLGRQWLADTAAGWAPEIAVGTLEEAINHRRRAAETVIALTPSVQSPAIPDWVVPTVGAPGHVHALAAGATRRVAVKLQSSMRRYGTTPKRLPDLVDAVHSIDAAVHCFVLHLPLLGEHRSADDNVAETEQWLAVTTPDVPLSVSHLPVPAFIELCERHRSRQLSLRLGTALWHGDKSFFQLHAEVTDVRSVRAGDRVGYRSTVVPDDGWLVMVGAGSAHGVAPLADGRSPFHFDRRRLALVEAPHMHTSMLFVGRDLSVPVQGDWVDVQRPLISVHPDEVAWQ
jgi:alanine racemase